MGKTVMQMLGCCGVGVGWGMCGVLEEGVHLWCLGAFASGFQKSPVVVRLSDSWWPPSHHASRGGIWWQLVAQIKPHYLDILLDWLVIGLG